MRRTLLYPIPTTPPFVFTSNKSALFDKTKNQYIDFGNVADESGADGFSISTWVKMNLTYWGVVLSKYSGDGPGNVTGFDWAISGNACLCEFCSPPGVYQISVGYTGSNIQDGNWHHIVWTSPGSAAGALQKIYIDGVYNNQNSGGWVFGPPGSSSNTGSLCIGGKHNWAPTSMPYNGGMTDVSKWPIILTAPEVAEIYNLGHPGNLRLHSRWNDLKDSTRGLWVTMETDMTPADTTPIGIIYDRKESNKYNATGVNSPTLVTDTP